MGSREVDAYAESEGEPVVLMALEKWNRYADFWRVVAAPFPSHDSPFGKVVGHPTTLVGCGLVGLVRGQVAIHGFCDALRDPVSGNFQRVVSEMRIASRGRRMLMAENLANQQ